MAETRSITFRPLREDDLPRMFAWRSAEHVSRWWHVATYEEVAAKYTKRIAGVEPVHCFLILRDGQPIGYIQWYRLWNAGVVIAPPYAELPPLIPHSAAGVDLFIGEADFLYRGFGPAILRALLREHIFAEPDIMGCIIGPDPRNASAIRSYEKAGFRYVCTVFQEETGEEEYVMYLAREEFERD